MTERIQYEDLVQQSQAASDRIKFDDLARQNELGTLTVRMPDGTLVKNVPAGTTKAQLVEKLDGSEAARSIQGFDDLKRNSQSASVPSSSSKISLSGPTLADQGIDPPENTFPEVFTENASRGFIDNLINLPNALGELAGTALAGATAGVRTFGESLGAAAADVNAQSEGIRPAHFSFGETFKRNNEIARNTFPASTLIGGTNLPDTFDIEATAAIAPGIARDTFGQPIMPGGVDDMITFEMQEMMREARQNRPQLPVGDQFSQARDDAVEGALARREAQPFAANAGDVAGDALTLLSGRAPLAQLTRNQRLQARRQLVGNAVQKLDPSARQLLDDVVSSKFLESLKSGGIKVAEAGFEGALIAALNDENPLNSAALSAGSQTLGSLFLSSTEGAFGKKGANLVRTAAVATAFIQLYKSASPGGKDSLLDSGASAFNKVAALIALGGLSSVAGFGRLSERRRDQIPIIADAVTSLPRGSVISMLSDLGDDSEGQTELILRKMAEDPNFFGPTAARRIQRALTHDEVRLKDTIDFLMTDRKFRRKLAGLRE